MENFNPKFQEVSIYPLNRSFKTENILKRTIEKFIKFVKAHYFTNKIYNKHFRIPLIDALDFRDDDKELKEDIHKYERIYLDISIIEEKEFTESDKFIGYETIIELGFADGGNVFFPSYKFATANYTVKIAIDCTAKSLEKTTDIQIDFI